MLNFFMTLFFLVVSIFAHVEDKLVVSYGTTHLNGIDKSVIGVLVSPSNKEMKTKPMGPFDHCTIIVDTPEEGTYQVYFKALQTGAYRLCSIVGGILVSFSSSPQTPVILSPKHSQIQSFAAGRQIRLGDTTKPIGYFQIRTGDM